MARNSSISKVIERDPKTGRPTALVVTVVGFAPYRLTRKDVVAAIAEEAFYHGMSQKLGDAGALERLVGPDGTEQNATPENKYAAIGAVWARLTHHAEPSWNAVEDGDGVGSIGLLVRALAEYLGCDINEAKKAVATWDRKRQADMRGDKELAPIIARLKAEDAARRPSVATVDTSAILAAMKKAA